MSQKSSVQQSTQYVSKVLTLDRGLGAEDAAGKAFAWVARQSATQAQLLAYIDIFFLLMLVALSAVPLALLLRRVKLGGPLVAAH